MLVMAGSHMIHPSSVVSMQSKRLNYGLLPLSSVSTVSNHTPTVCCLLIYPQDFFGKSDPFLEFYKQTETGWQLAHRTEVQITLCIPCHLVHRYLESAWASKAISIMCIDILSVLYRWWKTTWTQYGDRFESRCRHSVEVMWRNL